MAVENNGHGGSITMNIVVKDRWSFSLSSFLEKILKKRPVVNEGDFGRANPSLVK